MHIILACWYIPVTVLMMCSSSSLQEECKMCTCFEILQTYLESFDTYANYKAVYN